MAPSGREERGSEARGFTLIELLVVIAIIGILSYIILPSLFSARQQGNDAGVESDLETIKTQAEIYYTQNNNGYGTPGNSCATAGSIFSDPTIMNAVAQITQDANSATIACNNASDAFAVQALLTAQGGTTYECMDSTGNPSTSTTPLGTATVCP